MDTKRYECGCGWEGVPDGAIKANSIEIITLPLLLGLVACIFLSFINRDAIAGLFGCLVSIAVLTEILFLGEG